MAFVTNSTNTVALRKTEIERVEIVPVTQEGESVFVLRVGGHGDFDKAPTLEEAQKLLEALLKNLEE
jgi:hypothetical protein